MIVRDYGELITPSAVMAELAHAFAQATALDGDVQRAAPISFDVNGWRVWFAAFSDFNARMLDSWSIFGVNLDAIWNTNIDQLRAYESDLSGWAQAFRSLGGSPTITPSTPGGSDLFGTITAALPWAVGALALVYLGPAVGKILGDLAGSKRGA